jgi:hypothetical protein
VTRAWIFVGVALVALVLVAYAILRWIPQVPADAAGIPVARAAAIGQGCLPRISGSAGYMDACWDAYRYPDADPEKDYYILRMHGTFGPASGGSPRWAVLKAVLDGSPAGDVFMTWPDGARDGSCESIPVDVGLYLPDATETVCGHVTGVDAGTWGHEAVWTCVGCLLPDSRDRALSLYEAVGVPEGTTPAWQIYADVGG